MARGSVSKYLTSLMFRTMFSAFTRNSLCAPVPIIEWILLFFLARKFVARAAVAAVRKRGMQSHFRNHERVTSIYAGELTCGDHSHQVYPPSPDF